MLNIILDRIIAPVKPKGSTEVQVECNGQKTRGSIIATNGNYLNWSGRDILRKIIFNWKSDERVYCTWHEIQCFITV